ncbi:peptidyl-prolyl cis-trans isomerase B-like [Clavelina lepadiformis]|uniref:Peptidyl-prolyl cis-trans isomerase n=1 Tax=Clavelina lepadiformis TaxID=159417 RepID=A0ABP0F6R8_CLALP
MDRKSIVILILALTLFGKIGAADSSEKEGAGDDAGENVNAEAEAKTNTPKDEKEYNDSTKPEGDANSKKKELPDTININGKEIPIERADRTITSKATFEVSFGKEVIGNISFGLFGRTCPKTVRNFVTLANPNRPNGEGYKGSKIHRIVKGFAFQGGDFLNNDGSGGWSIFGRYFRDESFAIKHFPFCLSMANSGPNTNASQFFVPVIRTSWLDGKHVVFGQVIGGHKVAKKINDVKVNNYDRPFRQVWISNTWVEVYKKTTSRSDEL